MQTLSLHYLRIANLTGYWVLRTLPNFCYYVYHNRFPQ